MIQGLRTGVEDDKNLYTARRTGCPLLEIARTSDESDILDPGALDDAWESEWLTNHQCLLVHRKPPTFCRPTPMAYMLRNFKASPRLR